MHIKHEDSDWLLENDLEKQDKQTDEEIIEFEFKMYEMLGVHPTILSLWHTVHSSWRFFSLSEHGTMNW